jgi:hypothetical protein
MYLLISVAFHLLKELNEVRGRVGVGIQYNKGHMKTVLSRLVIMSCLIKFVFKSTQIHVIVFKSI